jgi:hypothetical protein
MDALRTYGYYLSGSHIKIKTDHQPLKYLLTQPKLSARQQRWVDELSAFDFEITYKPGREHVVPDALSRRPQTEVNALSIWQVAEGYGFF